MLRLQVQPDEYSVRNIFEGLCSEEVTVSGKDVFEAGFKFEASKARKKFGVTSSSVYREEDRHISPSSQKYQKLEIKLKHNLTGEKSGSDWGEK